MAKGILATHTFQAPGFEGAPGHGEDAAIRDYPVGHAQLLQVKQLVASGGA
jgi:hypothetical protein